MDHLKFLQKRLTLIYSIKGREKKKKHSIFFEEEGAMKTDKELQHDVMEELEWEPSVNPAEIGVIVKDSVVTLAGYVDSFSQRWAAERAAKRVSGVKAVAEEIEVRLPATYQRTDSDIALAAINALEWNVAVPHDHIKVIVRDGWLTLEGEVNLCYQRRAAEDAIRHLSGVRGVTNAIAVKSKNRPGELKAKIENAIERNAQLKGRNITVEIWDDRVMLYGTVFCLAEQDEAERIACSAPGVNDVENHITIAPQIGKLEETTLYDFPKTQRVRTKTEKGKK
jgi:osmotically-inducible protein OsmY